MCAIFVPNAWTSIDKATITHLENGSYNNMIRFWSYFHDIQLRKLVYTVLLLQQERRSL